MQRWNIVSDSPRVRRAPQQQQSLGLVQADRLVAELVVDADQRFLAPAQDSLGLVLPQVSRCHVHVVRVGLHMLLSVFTSGRNGRF